MGNWGKIYILKRITSESVACIHNKYLFKYNEFKGFIKGGKYGNIPPPPKKKVRPLLRPNPGTATEMYCKASLANDIIMLLEYYFYYGIQCLLTVLLTVLQ